MEKLTNRILLIDDNLDNLELLSDLIQHAFPGYAPLTANSGVKGLELAASQDPDVILLDVVMPGMNGFEVCRKLKSDPKTSLIPVVFITAIKGDREARLQAIEVGADAFLSRPVDESELKAQIRAMQKIKNAAALQQEEKQNLANLVAQQTQTLQQTHIATLNLLDDLHAENEARKQNEAALQESEDKFRYLFDYSVAPKSVTQLSGSMEVNQAFCDMLGYSREELKNRPWQELTHPEDVEMNQNAIDTLLSGEKVSIRLTKRYIHKNGSIVWVDFGTALRRDQNGQPLYLISTFTDITERKQAEEALRESEQRFRTLFDKAPVGIYISRNGISLYSNQKDLQMFGLSSMEEIIGRPVTDFLAPQSLEASLERTRRRALGLPTPKEIETVGLRPDGTQFPAQVLVDSVQLADGPANLSFITDITEIKQAQALQEAVYQIAAATESTASLEELYPKIHQSILSVMPAENFYIALYDANRDLLQFPYFKDLRDAPFDGEVQPGQGMTAYVLRSGSSLLCTQAGRQELVRQGKVKEQGSACAIWLGVPLIVSGKPIGAMVVQHYTNPQAYGEREQHMLEFVSTQVAITISRKQAEGALRKSESKFRAVVENSHDGVVFTDAIGLILYRSPAFASINGFTPEERLGKSIFELIHPDDVQLIRSLWAEMLAHPEILHRAQYRIRHEDGTWRWIETVALNLLANPDVQAIILSSHDITEHKQAQDLQQAVYQIAAAAENTGSLEELYPKIHQCISSVMPAEDFYIALYDEAQNLLRFPYFKNPRDESFVNGVQPGRGTTAYVLRTGKSLLCTRARHAELERQGEVILLGVPSAIWLGVPLIVEGKTIGAMVVQHYSDPQAYSEREQHMLEFVSTQVAIAISRKQAEAALHENEARYRGLFENSPVALWEEDFSEVKRLIEKIRASGVTDFRAFFEAHPQVLLECIGKIKVLDVNAAALTMINATDKGQLIENLPQIFRDDVRNDFVEELVSIAEGQIEYAWESANYTLDGQKLTLSLQRSAAPGYEDTLGKVLVSIMDITERKRAEKALRENEEKYRNLFNNSEVGMFRTRLDGSEILEFNEKYLKILGYSAADVKGKPSVDIWADKRERDRMVKMLHSHGQVSDFECVLLTKQGEPRTCITSLRSYPEQEILEGSILDITERKQAEDQIHQLNASLEQRVVERTRQLGEAQEQLVRQEKLATLGQLAGGVGHELRNPLGVINSAVYYLKLVQPDANEKIKKYHGIIEQEVNTASRIINDLLDFGRIVSPDRQPVSVPELVQHVLTRFPVPAAVQLQLKLPASLPKVFVDPIHLEQVLGNLITNACQAMKDCKDGARLVISASRRKDQVAIAVQDSGTGISPEAMQRLFEPLFTTKLRGIGLGLAVSKKLTEANGGSITVRSKPGHGATFTLTLPVKA